MEGAGPLNLEGGRTVEQNSPDPVDETDRDRQKEYDPRPSQGCGLPRGDESWLVAHLERWAFLGAEVSDL